MRVIAKNLSGHTLVYTYLLIIALLQLLKNVDNLAKSFFYSKGRLRQDSLFHLVQHKIRGQYFLVSDAVKPQSCNNIPSVANNSLTNL